MCFKMFDYNNDGSISLKEFKEILSGNMKIDEQVWKELVMEIDDNSDGEIDYEEFKSILLKIV